MSATIPLRSFASGEIAPSLWARVDQLKYQSGLELCRNMFTRREGSASNRSGHAFICPMIGWVDDYARGIDFVFNNDQAYVLIFTDGRLQFVRDGAPILETAKNITAITAANPPVVTSNAHGFSNGDLLYLDDVEGMVEVSRRFFTAANVTANTYALHEEAAIDGTGFTAYTGGGTARRVYSIATPFAGADLAGIRYKQSADVMILVNDGYTPQKLSRIADTNWTMADAEFEPAIDQPETGAMTGTAGADVIRYQVTAIAEDTGEESFAGYGNAKAFADLLWPAIFSLRVTTTTNHNYVTGERVLFRGIVDVNFTFLNGRTYTIEVTGATTFTLDGTTLQGIGQNAVAPAGSVEHNRIYSVLTFPTSVNPVTVTWGAVPAAIEYNIYREINGIFAYIGTSASTSFEDLGYGADASDTPPVSFDLFSLSGNPGAVGFFQQRLTLGGFASDQERARASRIGLFYNFTRSNPTQSDDAISFITNSGKVNRILHFEELERLLVFTSGNVISIEGDEAGSLTPTAINPRIRSGEGCAEVKPIVAGTAILFVQKQGRIINEIIPNQPGQAFQSRNVTVWAPHLFEGRAVVDWAWAANPFGIVWAVMDDGEMVGFTYLREQEVWGWHRHDTGKLQGDEYVGVCAIPEAGETITYPLVRRLGVNGQSRIYCERMATRDVPYAADGRFVDSYRVDEDANEDAGKTYELRYNSDFTDDDSDAWSLTIGGTTPQWTGDDVGRVILLYGPDGERLWCTINVVVNTNNALVGIRGDTSEWFEDDNSPNDGLDDEGEEDGTKPFPVDLPFSTATWSASVTEVTDAWHLEGRTVSILGDGMAMGTALVTGGRFDLPAPAAHIVWGLRIYSDLKTLELDIAEGETLVDKSKEMGQVSLRLERTRGLRLGFHVSDLQEMEPDMCRPDEQYGEGDLHTGVITAYCKARTDFRGQVYIRQRDPLPVTILGAYPRVTFGEA